MAYGTFTLTGKHQLPDGTAHAGTAHIAPSTVLRDAAGDVILSGSVKVTLDGTGSYSKVLPAADVSLQPQPHGFTVTTRLHAGSVPSLTFAAPAPGVTLDVADIASSVLSPALVPNAATAQDVAAVNAAVTAETVLARAAEATKTTPAAAAAAAAALILAEHDAALAAANSTYGQLGISKGGGQNIANLRRPVFAIDRTYPDQQSGDISLLWAETNGTTLYGVGIDHTLRKSTTAGQTWSLKANSGSAGTYGTNGQFLKLASGALLTIYDAAGASSVYRSTAASDGAVWASVYALPVNATLLGSQSWVQDPTTGYIYVGQYVSVDAATKATWDVMRSVDDGLTWQTFQTFPRSGAGAVRHAHTMQWDPVGLRVWICTGDGEADAGIYQMNAGGTAFAPVATNANLTPLGLGGVNGTAVGMMFFPDAIAWAMDATMDSYVWSMPRTEIGAPFPAAVRGYRLNSTAWWSACPTTDYTEWVISGSNGRGETVGTRLDDVAHLYRVGDNGTTVDEIMTMSMEPTVGTAITSTFAPVGTPLQGAALGGRLLLSAHSLPNIANGGGLRPFSLMGRIAWGASPTPRPPATKKFLREATQSSGSVTLAASQTVVFGHVQAVRYLSNVGIVDFGISKQSGTGTVRVEVYNLTTSTLVTSTLTASYRYSINAFTGLTSDAGVFPSTGDILQFRVTETGGSSGAVVTAFVSYGFGF